MTIIAKRNVDAKSPTGDGAPAWRLAEAKARFSELVRRVHQQGPQRVSVHGRDEVVVLSIDEYERLKGEPTGQALIDAMQASPHRDTELTLAAPVYPPVREIVL